MKENLKVLSEMEKKLNKYELFNLCKELYALYETSYFNNELYNFFYKTINKYNLQLETNISTQNIRAMYNILINKYYHNEITIKSNFINNVIQKKQEHVTIFELNAGSSRVDLCKVNGNSVAYEIKTDLDNLNRLNKQLNDYLKAFEEVYVICSSNKLYKILEIIPTECGIYVYSCNKLNEFKFKRIKKALKSKKIDSKKQLSLLTIKQLNNLLKVETINRMDLENKIMNTYSKRKINNLFKEQLKIKYGKQWNFLTNNKNNIFEIDYQWFFKNNAPPTLIYK